MGVKEFFNNILLSLTGKDEGFSYRKVLSLVILGMAIYLHIHFASESNALSFLLYDFGFIAVLLGLLNLDRFVQAKWGREESAEPPVDVPVDTPVDVDNPDNCKA